MPRQPKTKSLRDLIRDTMQARNLTAYALAKIDKRIVLRTLQRYVAEGSTSDVGSETIDVYLEALGLEFAEKK
jgi:hypothetical protein